MKKQQITINSDSIYKGNLVLVNQAHPIYKEPHKQDLEHLFGKKEITLLKEPSNVLEQLIKDTDMEEEVAAISGYRTKEEQTSIYNDSLQENGAAFTKKYVALPGHSEHQTGLAIDLAKNQPKIDFICPEFPYNGSFAKFREKAVQYGFVERYRKDKENITQIAAEPWHFRYVGVPHAKLMQENNMALEEYINWVKQYDLNENLLKYVMKKQTFWIGYVPVQKENKCCFTIPECTGFYLSGNNVDGCVVTLYG